MNPKDCKYTKEHEWIRPEAGNTVKMGLADYAQSHLGDIVYLDLPAPGTQVQQSQRMGEVESVKAVADIFAPVSGKVLETNPAVIDEPGLVNQDCYGKGWLVKLEISNPPELDNLMDSPKYEAYVIEQSKEE